MADQQNAEMGFFDHLEELRWHIIRSIIGIVVITVLSFFAKSFIFDTIIMGPKSDDFFTYKAFCWLSKALNLGESMCINPTNFEVVNIEMAGQFLTHLKVSLILGFIASFPYILWEFWRFIRPGLYAGEQKYTRGVVFFSSLLFFFGIAFGYYILSPLSINFFANYSVGTEIVNTIKLSSYIGILSTIVLSAGIMFELPMIVYFLSKLGLVTPSLMKRHRKHALIVILIVAAIITPADVYTQILVTIPVYFLYELSIYISAYVVRNQEKALAEM